MPKRNRHKERIKAERLTQEQIYINKANLFFGRKQAQRNDWERRGKYDK